MRAVPFNRSTSKKSFRCSGEGRDLLNQLDAVCIGEVGDTLAMMNDEILFTFIVERRGWTLVEQVGGRTLREAALLWAKFSPNIRGVNLETAGFVTPSPIDGTKNVWFFSTRDEEDTAVFVNVVATVNVPVSSGY